MKLEVTQEKLAKALNNVSRVATGRVTLPVLNNVLIRVDDNKVSLITTNLDMAVVDFLPVISSEDGVITVPAKAFSEFISTLPRGEKILLSSEGTKVTITAGKYHSIINGTLADDFPELPELAEDKAVIFKIGVDEFKHSVSQVVCATSNDTTRPALTGVYFNTKDKVLSIAATDGYRLTEKQLIKDVKSDISVVVPSPTLQEVLRSISDDMDEIEIAIADDLIRFRLGELEIISKLIDASYPDYRQLFPKDSDIIAEVDRDELIRVTKLAGLFARHSARGSITITATTPDSLSIKSVASELGENDSTITTPIPADGKITVNSRFFLDALNALDEPKIRLTFSSKPSPLTGRTSPAVLYNLNSDDYAHLVMPLDA